MLCVRCKGPRWVRRIWKRAWNLGEFLGIIKSQQSDYNSRECGKPVRTPRILWGMNVVSSLCCLSLLPKPKVTHSETH